MLYNVIKRIIEHGGYDAEELRGRIDVLYAAGSLTTEQYNELVGLMGVGNESA